MTGPPLLLLLLLLLSISAVHSSDTAALRRFVSDLGLRPHLVSLDLSGNPDLHGIVPRLRGHLLCRSLSENSTTNSTSRRQSTGGAAPAPSPLPSPQHSYGKSNNKNRVRNGIIGFVGGLVAGIVLGMLASAVYRMLFRPGRGVDPYPTPIQVNTDCHAPLPTILGREDAK